MNRQRGAFFSPYFLFNFMCTFGGSLLILWKLIPLLTNLGDFLNSCSLNRDAYGFAVRPQHLQRYREYANIYKVISLFQYFSCAKFPSV